DYHCMIWHNNVWVF
nr:immunoglobulin light chain junction region [Macaca mulatta]